MLKGLTFTRLIIHNYDIDNIDIKESYYFSSSFYKYRSLLFLLKAGSTNRETYFLESRKNGGGNNRGNRSSTRFTFPGFNHRIQPGGEKRSARIKITAPCAPRYRAEIKMGIAVWFPLRPSQPSSPPSPQVFPDTEGRSLVWMHHESETGCKYKTKAGSAASTPRLVSRDVLALWGWLLRLISRCRV